MFRAFNFKYVIFPIRSQCDNIQAVSGSILNREDFFVFPRTFQIFHYPALAGSTQALRVGFFNPNGSNQTKALSAN